VTPATGATRLESGPHSAVWRLDGPHSVVVKVAPAGSTRREAAALTAVRALAIAPHVIAEGSGTLVLQALPGAAAPLDRTRAAVLGATLRRLHESRPTGYGSWPDWDRPATTIAAYHERSILSALAWAGTHAVRAETIAARLPAPPAGDAPPFRRLHGDLWRGNILWHGDEVALVDWEYSRQGDPAEELAYLAEMDALEESVVTALLEAYGAAIAPRVAAWRPLAALLAGLWFHDVGLEERATALLDRAAALCGLR
jgi:aminoglycoside phosphotransferase (APT) family kinase protein